MSVSPALNCMYLVLHQYILISAALECIARQYTQSCIRLHLKSVLNYKFYFMQYITYFVFVSELVGRVRNVILINVYLDLENPGGQGFWVGGYMGQVREWRSQFTSNLGTRWTDPVTARRVPSKQKGEQRGAKENMACT